MKAAFPYWYIPELRTFSYGYLVGLNIKKEARATDKQRLSDKPPLTRCGVTYKLKTGGSNLKAKLKILC